MNRWTVGLSGAVLLALSGGLPAAAENITLRVASWEGPDTPDTRAVGVIKQFEADHPGVKVEWETSDWNSYWSKIPVQVAAGSPPDLIMITYAEQDVSWIGLNIFQPLDPFLKTQPELLADFPPQILQAGMMNGKHYYIPTRINVMSWIYNKDLVQQAGLVEPHVGWTWNDMADLAQKLTKRGADGKVDIYGTYIDTWPLMLYNFIYGAGGQLFDDESTIFPGKAVYNGPKAVEGLQFYTDLATKMDVAAPPNIGGQYPFGKGKLGFLHTGDHVLSDKNFMGGINYGATIAPIGPNGKQFVAQAGGTGYGLAAGSKHPELAWELMQALMSEPVLKSIGETDSAIITRLSVQRELSPDLWANKLWREGGAYFRPVPVVGFNDVLAAPLGKAMQDVTVKHVPLVQALDTAVQASNVALADWKQKIAQAAQ